MSTTQQQLITISYFSFQASLVVSFCVGIVVGFIVCYSTFLSKTKTNDKGRNETRLNPSNDDDDETILVDPTYQILEGALHLFRNHCWTSNNKTTKVVNYLPPQTMLNQFFCCTSEENKNLSLTCNDDTKPFCETMIQLFKIIQTYSVNTSHRYFFNQLYGAIDPIALASEIIALSVNTSVATFEIAPVFTLLEREVILATSDLVYGSRSDDCDGIMMPGGSLSNLVAIHVARHWVSKYWNETIESNTDDDDDGEICDEKKECTMTTPTTIQNDNLVAFVTQESHYSFLKAASVTGLSTKNVVIVPTLSNGVMNVEELHAAISRCKKQGKLPFFIGLTAGSTVRGSFDPIEEIVTVVTQHHGGGIWIHVDGAWGGAAVFSERDDLRRLMRGVHLADSFTFNPHKMLGAPQQTSVFVSRHKDILKSSNSTKAKYLFDKRKNGADFDLGDAAITCGRRTDAIKLWAMWKYYGQMGLARQVEEKVDSLQTFVKRICEHDAFVLACTPWPFNVNFYYLPKRIRKMIEERELLLDEFEPVFPEDISKELGDVTVKLKLRLHEAGEMMIAYQPIRNQRADCFRLVLAGRKIFDESDICHIMCVMHKYGNDL